MRKSSYVECNMESIIYANQELILIPAERKEIQLTRGQVDKGTNSKPYSNELPQLIYLDS